MERGVIHWVDPKRGRASIYRAWSKCGKAVGNRLATVKGADVTCSDCMAAVEPHKYRRACGCPSCWVTFRARLAARAPVLW